MKEIILKLRNYEIKIRKAINADLQDEFPLSSQVCDSQYNTIITKIVASESFFIVQAIVPRNL